MDTKNLFKDGYLNLPSNMSKGTWSSLGEVLANLKKSYQWHLGDWALFGMGKFRMTLVKAAKIAGVSPGYLSGLRTVAQRFSPSMRTEKLSWEHYRTVCLVSDPGERLRLLRKAKKEKISGFELRCYLSGKERPEEYKIILVWPKPPDGEILREVHEIISKTGGKVRFAGLSKMAEKEGKKA